MPDAATNEQKQETLSAIRDQAITAVERKFGLSHADALQELDDLFDLNRWKCREKESECCWLVGPQQVKEKTNTLVAGVTKIERVAQDRYTADRRLREQRFQDEIYGRFEMARQEDRDFTPWFLQDY